MANEGSTKPTNLSNRCNLETTDDGLRVCLGHHEKSADCEWEYYVPKDSLARVRGLLQRLEWNGAINTSKARCPTCGSITEELTHEPDCELRLILAGAESADIGKLDRVDESKLKELLRRGYHLFNVEGTDFAESEEVGEKWMEEVEAEMKLGSAETGGEKAASGELAEGSHPLLDFNEFDYEDCAACAFVGTDPCPYHIGFANGAKWAVTNFRSTSQNQAVSSGVEGAHEGTTADKSVALAESSLSSPPSAGVINVREEEQK